MDKKEVRLSSSYAAMAGAPRRTKLGTGKNCSPYRNVIGRSKLPLDWPPFILLRADCVFTQPRFITFLAINGYTPDGS